MQMVVTGLQSLLSEHLDEIQGKRVGILANHASVTDRLVHISDALSEAGVKIRAMFGPEHGVRGDLADGVHAEDAINDRLLVPVYSLYGARMRPTSGSLHGVDVMLVDLQDIGARFYTFIYTLGEVMRACGEKGIPVWVLDRPNPISGVQREGPVCLPEFSYASFDVSYPLPIRHGLTIGELARLFVARFGIACDLRVIPMKGWQRGMWYADTGLPWVLPSPNMPTPDTATVYPGLCLIEGISASEGRGTTRPFELIGAPWIDAAQFRKALDALDIPGAAFREAYFTPSSSKFAGEHCEGIQVHVIDRDRFQPVFTAVTLVSVMLRLYPKNVDFRASGERMFFDVLCGTDEVRKSLLAGVPPAEIAASWQPGIRQFEQDLAEALIY
jgi:uncharacterized protein YbbC (DUF1343 family)